jgi:hypothetical protein
VGINIYKRLNNLTRGFDPEKAKEFPPESCGFAVRLFKLNKDEEAIEIRNPKNKHLEQKIHVKDVKSILLTNYSKNLIKNRKNMSMKPNIDINKILNKDYLTFSLVLTEGSLDLISSNYNIFVTFESAIDAIITSRKNINEIIKLV